MRLLSEIKVLVKSSIQVPERPWEFEGKKGVKPAHVRLVVQASAMSEERGLEDVAEDRLVVLEAQDELPPGPATLRVFPRLRNGKVETVVHSVVKGPSVKPADK